MQIGQVAKQLGCSVGTLRFYEQRGLIAPPYRTEANYRHYDGVTVERLRFILRCRELDMTLDEIERLLAIRDQPATACDSAHEVIANHIDHVLARINELEALQSDLLRMQRQCHQMDASSECQTLWQLARTQEGDRTKKEGTHIAGVHSDLAGFIGDTDSG